MLSVPSTLVVPSSTSTRVDAAGVADAGERVVRRAVVVPISEVSWSSPLT